MGTLVRTRDVLEEMRELRAVLRKHRWVSVEDKLPQKYNDYSGAFNYVLVFDRRWGVDMARRDGDAWVSRLMTKYSDVTHWMPLPSAPEDT